MEDRNEWLAMFRTMWRIRHFEMAAFRLYTGGRLPGFMHISIGQEAVSVGACSALQPGDFMSSTHRGHGDTLAKGVDPKRAMAELFGRASGACRGKGGSMHISDFSKGILGANGIVSAGIPISLGAALGLKQQDRNQVVLCFFGDGALMEGLTHESFNMAVLWQVPVIYVQQNNQYAESTPPTDYQGIPDITTWARSYGMPAHEIDGNDLIAVHHTVRGAAERARCGNGPSFIRCNTYRWYGHNIGDTGAWRPKAEIEAWKAKDPIARHANYLLEHGIATAHRLEEISAQERELIDAAVAFAESSATPDPEAAFEDVYVHPAYGKQALIDGRL